ATDIGLEALTFAYIAAAFRAMGMEYRGDQVSTTSLAWRLGVVDRHRRLFERFLDILEEEHAVARAGSEWRIVAAPKQIEPDALAAEILERHPAYSAEIALLARCGAQMAGVLRGETDPLQLIFPDGSLDDARKLYEESPFARACSGLVC